MVYGLQQKPHLSLSGGIIMLYRPQNEEGQGLVEYALILVMVAVVVVVVLIVLGPVIGNSYSSIIGMFPN